MTQTKDAISYYKRVILIIFHSIQTIVLFCYIVDKNHLNIKLILSYVCPDVFTSGQHEWISPKYDFCEIFLKKQKKIAYGNLFIKFNL